MNPKMSYGVIPMLALASICWSMQTAAAKTLHFNSENVRLQSQDPPKKYYAACYWPYFIAGKEGLHLAVSPVYEYGPSYLTYACSPEFGRWVAKNHPEMSPKSNPDSPKYIVHPLDESTIQGAYTTKGEAETARQQLIAKYKRNATGVIIEDLEWTPKS
ncbi:MAG TPA: hypothetical protein VG075_04805 [Candidatus Acidoferrum sp.]|jgi:hypothetical protein|nr:hypothetical protein [Candidatus Acidoferrum sp.]